METITSEITRLRDCLILPIDEVPETWRLFVIEYHRQKATADAYVLSDDADLRWRGELLLRNLEGMI